MKRCTGKQKRSRTSQLLTLSPGCRESYELRCLAVFLRGDLLELMVLGWKNNAFNTMMLFHPLPVATVSQHANKT